MNRIPETLEAQLRLAQRRLWAVETTIAVLGGLCGLLASYLLLFISDRFWATPAWLRFSFTAAGIIGAALGAWWWASHLSQRRDLRATARLILGGDVAGEEDVPERLDGGIGGTGGLRQRLERALLRAARQVRRRRRAGVGGQAHRRRAGRRRLHLRRHRVGQPRAAGRGRGLPRHRPHRPRRERNRARSRPRDGQGAREARLDGHRCRRGRVRRGRSGAAEGRGDHPHGVRLGHAREQRVRDDPADRRAGGYRARGGRTVPHRRRAERRQGEILRSGRVPKSLLDPKWGKAYGLL